MPKTNNHQHLPLNSPTRTKSHFLAPRPVRGVRLPAGVLPASSHTPPQEVNKSVRSVVKYLLIALLLTLLLPTITFASGSYSGGDGQPTTPFQIAEPNDLIEMSQHSEDWSKHFILTDDINLNFAEPNTFTTALIAPDTVNNSDWSFEGTPFTGNFNGQNHSIHNLTIDTNGISNDHLGLFGLLDGVAIIKNLSVKNVNIAGGADSYLIGGLVGDNFGRIYNCCVTGFVQGGNNSMWHGLLVGYNNPGAVIINCYVDGSVSGYIALGGLAGANRELISNCYAIGSVTGNQRLGGLVGYNYNSTITNCYANVSVTGQDNSFRLGGLTGDTSGTIASCYATGTITDGNFSRNLGGLVGENNGLSSIRNCYATGSVTGGENSACLGGFIGINYRSINNCYSAGSVSSEVGSGNIGGLCGRQYSIHAIMENCFWNTESSGMSVGYNLDPTEPGTITNVFGKTTAEMQIQSTFTDYGWDFVAETANGSEYLWHLPYNTTGYPMLYFQRDIPGDFTGSYGVDLADYAFLADFWADTNCDPSNNHCSGADLDQSSHVALPDLMLQLSHWLDGK